MSKKSTNWYNKLSNVNDIREQLRNIQKATNSEKRFADIRRESEKRDKNSFISKKYNVPNNFKENEIDHEEMERILSKKGGKKRTKKNKNIKRKSKRRYKIY